MSLGPWEIALIAAVIILLFGAGKLPRLMGDIAEGVKAFKKGLKDEHGPGPTAEDEDDNTKSVK
jgi:sec-independent protein translocase protein TatA